MSQTLEDTAAVVTGASSGIGRAIALRFADEGARVTVATRHEEPRSGGRPTHELIRDRGGAGLFVETDVRSLDDLRVAVEATVDAYGSLDVMVNNAGVVGSRRPIEDVDEDEYDRVVDTNLRGTYFGCQTAIERMKRQPGGGVVVNVASTSGRFGLDSASAYCASKGGVANLTRALAIEGGPHDVRVNAIDPGTIETGMTTEDSETADEEMARRIPLRRVGQPSEVAGAAVFLASDDAAYITGENIVVDGGKTVREN